MTTGPAGKPAGAVGTPCSTVANQTQRFALTVANPLQGNQYTGGGGGSVLINYNGMANYNGLITTVQHRLSSSFSLLANYTWSKCLSLSDAQGDYAATQVENPTNPAFDYGPCGSDFRNIENIVVITKSNFHISNRITSCSSTTGNSRRWCIFRVALHLRSRQDRTTPSPLLATIVRT